MFQSLMQVQAPAFVLNTFSNDQLSSSVVPSSDVLVDIVLQEQSFPILSRGSKLHQPSKFFAV